MKKVGYILLNLIKKNIFMLENNILVIWKISDIKVMEMCN